MKATVLCSFSKNWCSFVLFFSFLIKFLLLSFPLFPPFHYPSLPLPSFIFTLPLNLPLYLFASLLCLSLSLPLSLSLSLSLSLFLSLFVSLPLSLSLSPSLYLSLSLFLSLSLSIPRPHFLSIPLFLLFFLIFFFSSSSLQLSQTFQRTFIYVWFFVSFVSSLSHLVGFEPVDSMLYENLSFKLTDFSTLLL